MPIYDIHAPTPEHLKKEGPLLPIEISIPQALVDYLTQQNMPLPTPATGMALIDTGASISVVDISVLSNLQISPVDITTMLTASGDRVQQNLFPARFVISNITLDFSAVCGANLQPQKIIALIGRDVLRHFLLFYHGNAGNVTISI